MRWVATNPLQELSKLVRLALLGFCLHAFAGTVNFFWLVNNRKSKQFKHWPLKKRCTKKTHAPASATDACRLFRSGRRMVMNWTMLSLAFGSFLWMNTYVATYINTETKETLRFQGPHGFTSMLLRELPISKPPSLQPRTGTNALPARFLFYFCLKQTSLNVIQHCLVLFRLSVLRVYDIDSHFNRAHRIYDSGAEHDGF